MEGETDQVEYSVGLLEDLLIREAQDSDTPTAKEGVAESITALSLGVGRTVHLDGQPRFDAKEVGEVVADGELSTELEAVDLSAAEPAPQERFGSGGAVAVPAAEDGLAAQSSLHEGWSARASSQFRGIDIGSRVLIVARCEGPNRSRAP